MRDLAHYQRMLANCGEAPIGASLAAKAVYAARYGDANMAAPDSLRAITRSLIARYGEMLSVEQVLAEMARGAIRRAARHVDRR